MSGKNKKITEKFHDFWAQIIKAYFFGNRTMTRAEGVVQVAMWAT